MFETIAQQVVNGVSTGMAYAVVALGLTLAFGVLRIVNFAHGELYMLGGLGCVLLAGMAGVPYLLSIPLAALLVGVAAWLIDLLAVRPVIDKPDGHSSVLLTTYAVGLLLFHSVLWTWGVNPYRVEGVGGALEVAGLQLSGQRLLVIGAGLLIFVGVELLLRRTRFGFELRALAQDGFAARAIGIDVARVRTATYAFAALLAGAAGALLVPITLYSPLIGQNVIIKAFVVAVIGGMGSVRGALACGLGLGILEALLGSVMEPGLALAAIYSLMVVALLVRPQGLFRPTR